MATDEHHALMGMLLKRAPNGPAQAKLSILFTEIEQDTREMENPDEAYLRTLAGMLLDGLAWGNWPWN